MNPYLENNFLVRLMEEMEEEEEELKLARHMVNRRRRAHNECRHGGSIPGRVRIHRDHMSGDARIRADYFGANPVYTDAQFRRRFRMRRHVFERLVDVVQQVDPYFIQRPNCAGEIGLSALQKVVAAVRISSTDSYSASKLYDVRTQHFATIQESARKDIERAFGVLQKRWGVVRGPAYGWSPEHIGDIMKTCIILHNMIVEDEGPLSLNTTFENIGVYIVVSCLFLSTVELLLC
ncbi:uncharacterized protein [Zea mays]|uniref:uncharacterized protein n=1 Tax=Zea mays TaxID=4577 RepID=UPI0004DEAC6D|nr:uncharacterized protein LOC103641547 [Zea mays]|eukprot:XP_008663118.1 uncharacterized protein LOC103641547 [Zea mays]